MEEVASSNLAGPTRFLIDLQIPDLPNPVSGVHVAMGANGDFSSPKVDSLEKALVCAMRTISLASEGPSARATELKPLPPVLTADPACPVTPGIGESDHRTERYDGSAMTRTLSAV